MAIPLSLMFAPVSQGGSDGPASGADALRDAVPDDPSRSVGDGLAETAPVQQAADWLDGLIGGLPGWGQSLVIVGVIAGIALLVQVVVYWILRLATSSDKRAIGRHLIRHTAHAARALAVVVGVTVGVTVCQERGLLPRELLAGYWPAISSALLVVCMTWLVVGLVSGGDDVILARHKMDVRDNLRARRLHTQVAVISRVLRIIVVIIGAAVALMMFDGVEELGASLLASAGIAGIAVGFAAKSVLGNLLAGIQIALTQPIRLDDAVVISGEWGWIEEITTTYVVVRIWDKRRLIVPFSKIIEEPFENWTRKSSDILGQVVLFTDFACDLDAVRAKLDEIVGSTDKWDGQTKVVQVTDTSERTMKVRVLVSAADSPTAWDLRCMVRERLLAWLREAHPEWLPRERQLNLESDPDAAEADEDAPKGDEA